MEGKKILALLIFIGIGLQFPSQGQTTYPLTSHPRLFFLQQDEQAVKDKIAAVPILGKIQSILVSECDKILQLPVPVQESSFGLNAFRESSRRIEFLSFEYRITGDIRYAARAEAEMIAIANYTDWDSGNQLSLGEMTFGMAVGYDWLYNYLSQKSRGTIATAIKQRGIEQTTGTNANKYYFLQNKREYYSNVNSIQVCNAGIAAGVASVYDENPAYYQPLIERAVNLVKFPMEVYQYNGSYPEGYMYWNYGTTFNIYLIDMLQTMWGSDWDLSKAPGFMTTGNFAIGMCGNVSQDLYVNNLGSTIPKVFNFGDSADGFDGSPIMIWLASHAPSTTNLYLTLKTLNTLILPDFAWTHVENPWLLIWSKNVLFDNVLPPAETTYIAHGLSAVATFRSGWNTSDLYLGLKGGTPAVSHSHMDAGSFVFDAMGMRWAMDFGGGTCSDCSATGKWNSFNFNNTAHNTLTINGHNQVASAYAAVDNLTKTTERVSADVDLTQIYSTDVDYCKRTGAIVSGRYAEITDVIRARGSGSANVRWSLLTKAFPMQISNKIILLSQASKKLYLILDGTDNSVAKTWITNPPNSLNDNFGTRLAGFEYSIPAGSTSTVTVRLVPDGDPILSGMNLTARPQTLNEDFESFSLGASSGSFVSWIMDPPQNSTTKAILGQVVANPFKDEINSSDKVFKITRPDDSGIINSSNASNFNNRGAQAFGYDLRANSNTVIELKYYKNSTGTMYLRLLDGGGNILGKAYSDPDEGSPGYTTAKWRTAQFFLGNNPNLTKYNFTPNGYFKLSIENTATEALQEKELIVYIDDIKMLPLTTYAAEQIQKKQVLSAFYDPAANRICVFHIPENSRTVRLLDINGRLLNETRVSGELAYLECKSPPASFYIIQVIKAGGTSESVKLVPLH